MSKEIVLCLSGGGYRATLFHLGVIDCLVQSGRIRDVKEVYGVSGGAFAAAHLAHNWEAYADEKTFETPAKDLLKHINKGIIDEILLTSFVFPFTRSSRLGKELKGLFEDNIPSTAPATFVLSSSMTDFT